jgi:hypothetical protein
MNFFGNILASSYNRYSRKKKIDVTYQAKLLVVYIQYILILLLFFLLNEFFSIGILVFLAKYKWMVLLVFALIFVITFKYYNKERVEYCIQRFNSKSLLERRYWGFITIAITILPWFLFFLIMLIRHPM